MKNILSSNNTELERAFFKHKFAKENIFETQIYYTHVLLMNEMRPNNWMKEAAKILITNLL